jgi:hypothetical protein
VGSGGVQNIDEESFLSPFLSNMNLSHLFKEKSAGSSRNLNAAKSVPGKERTLNEMCNS